MSARLPLEADEFSRLRGGLDLAGRLTLSRHCVRRDAYDEAAFKRLVDHNPKLTQCCRWGEARLRSFPALLSDIFCLLFKLRPTLVDRSLVRAGFQVNRYLIAQLAAERYITALRARTQLDEEAAGAATLSVAARLLDHLAAHDLADENVLLELEESIGGTKAQKLRPARTHPPQAASGDARGAGYAEIPTGKRLPYDLQRRLELADGLKSFRRIARLLAATRELRRQLASKDPTRWQATEVYDVGPGDELARLLPGELVSLRSPLLKKEFLRKLLGRQLLTYELRGREASGPMVLLVDASHSMRGEKECASKALAIALARIATGRGQPVCAILFGPRTTPLWQVEFQSGARQEQQIAALAEVFLGGGTDFERPISAAVKRISEQGAAGGQIVFISDGLSEVSEAWCAKVRATVARRQIEILAIVIDIEQSSHEAPASFSDRVTRWSELTSGIDS